MILKKLLEQNVGHDLQKPKRAFATAQVRLGTHQKIALRLRVTSLLSARPCTRSDGTDSYANPKPNPKPAVVTTHLDKA